MKALAGLGGVPSTDHSQFPSSFAWREVAEISIVRISSSMATGGGAATGGGTATGAKMTRSEIEKIQSNLEKIQRR